MQPTHIPPTSHFPSDYHIHMNHLTRLLQLTKLSATNFISQNLLFDKRTSCRFLSVSNNRHSSGLMDRVDLPKCLEKQQRLQKLRELMQEATPKLDIYSAFASTCSFSLSHNLLLTSEFESVVVPSEDAHSSEYIAPCDARREFISGFSGSAGCAVITLDKATLSTDGRYFNQAEKQLDSDWILLKQGLPDVPTWQDW